MNPVADLIETIAKADSSSWDIADHVAALPQRHEDGYRPFREVADEIWERLGVEWAPTVLSKYAVTARAFPDGARAPSVSFISHVELRAHPDKFTKWVAKNPGKVLTQAAARNMRGGTSAPKKDREAWRVQAEKAWKTLDHLVENDPAYFIDALERLITIWTARFPTAIGKAKHGLRAV